MNFAQFGVPLSAAMPVATQFSAGKITQSVTTPNGQVVGVLQGGENGVHYIRPLDANLFAQAAAGRPESPTAAQQGQTQTVITLPITMPGAKPGDPQQTVQIQVVNPAVTQASGGNSPKYQLSQIPLQTFGQGATVLTVAYNGNQEGVQILDGQNPLEGMTVVAALQPQDLQLLQAQADQQHQQSEQDDQQNSPDKENTNKEHPVPVALIKTELCKDGEMSQQTDQEQDSDAITIPTHCLQNATLIQDYLQKVQAQSLSLTSLHPFLKFNTHDIKRELITEESVIETVSIPNTDEHEHLIVNEVNDMTQEETTEDTNDGGKKKKKYKKKPPKPKKPKPGQVHIATALDGTTLFCCPECHMAYPEKDLLEQHLVGHKIERRFICDICGAGLKRKEHLERHKLGHNPERPFVCSVCMKGFKRKEHLNLHFVIHSGEKTEICGECGKGFYRKDHLRKHTRSHVTRRAKELAEKSQVLMKTGGNPDTTVTELGGAAVTNGTAQVTIQVGTGGPNSQIQIPVQIQVPQHQIQISTNEGEGSRTSTVVLPSASESISILPN